MFNNGYNSSHRLLKFNCVNADAYLCSLLSSCARSDYDTILYKD